MSSAVRFSMTADVENEHGGESLQLNILYCVYWSINTLFYVGKKRSDHVNVMGFIPMNN